MRPPGRSGFRAITDPDGDATDSDTSDDRDAIGARIEVDLDGSDFVGHVTTYLVGAAQSGNYAQTELAPLVGCGTASTVHIRVTFIDGSVVTEAASPGTVSELDVLDPP